MPPLAALTLPEIISAIVGTVGAGVGAYGAYETSQAAGQSSANAQAQNQSALSAQQLAAQQAGAQKQQAINAQVANADEQTGGSLNSGGLANLSSLLAGYGGQAGGGTTPTPLQSTSGAPGLQDALSSLTQQTQTTAPPATSFSGGS
jgi:hypothetical protein